MEKFKENPSPRVSVVIPTYNRPDPIERAIKSILNQTYQDFEIVVIDDSPNNETEKVIKTLHDNRIKYIKNKVKTNLPMARNQGVKESNPGSKYIALLDDDDEFLPLFLEKLVMRLDEKKDLIGAIPYFEDRYEDGTKIRRDNTGLICLDTPIGSGAVLRKSLFTEENTWFDEKLSIAEDWDFGIRVLKDHKIESVPGILHRYYYHPYSIDNTLSTISPSLELIDYLFQKHFSYFSTLGNKYMSSFFYYMGRKYCRAGNIKKGKPLFLRAFLASPHPVHLLYYFFWSFPKFAQNFHRDKLMHKILKFCEKIKYRLL